MTKTAPSWQFFQFQLSQTAQTRRKQKRDSYKLCYPTRDTNYAFFSSSATETVTQCDSYTHVVMGIHRARDLIIAMHLRGGFAVRIG